ncbi:AMP-binding protein [Halochromatium salexigens]|nr:AMP-binding protein [Halochromatium salexigens]
MPHMPHGLPEAACGDVLRSLLGAALSAHRGTEAPPAWDASAPLDSLERLHLAASVNTFFRLHETGSEDRLLMLRDFDDWVAFVAEATSSTSGLAFQTSGSTGAPTSHVHPWAHLATEAEALHQRLTKVAPIERVVAWLPLHHLYGFMLGVALPERMGLHRVWVQTAAPPRLHAGDLLVTVPPRWDYLARTRPDWPTPMLGVSSTATLAPATHAALLGQDLPEDQNLPEDRTGGLTGLLDIYGSTETGGIATRWQPEAPYTLLAHWQRHDATQLRHSSGAIVPLLDHTAWLDERRLTLGERYDAVISIGGVNVNPTHVAQRLEALASVATCAVRPTSGAAPRLKAFVVPAASEAEAAADIARATAQWPAAERPVSITYGAALPRTALGKLSDWSA